MIKNKSSSFDYEISMLPKSRKEVFRDILSLQYKTLLGLGFILFMFALPMQIMWYLKRLTLSSIYQEFSAGTLSVQDASISIIAVSNQFAFINIFLWVFIGVGLSGIIQIIKRFSWAEPVHGMHDFIKGIKQNGKHFTLLFLILGILSYISNLIGNFSNLVEGEMIYEYLGLIPKVVFIIIFLPVGACTIVNIAIYSNTFLNQVRLGFYIFISDIKKELLTLIILISPMLLFIVPVFIIQIVGRILVPILIPILLLKWLLVVSDCLDQHWNIKHFPELLNKGVLGIEATKIEPINFK